MECTYINRKFEGKYLHCTGILDYKCWYYETAKEAGTTAVRQNMAIDEIQQKFRGVKESMSRMREKGD